MHGTQRAGREYPPNHVRVAIVGRLRQHCGDQLCDRMAGRESRRAPPDRPAPRNASDPPLGASPGRKWRFARGFSRPRTRSGTCAATRSRDTRGGGHSRCAGRGDRDEDRLDPGRRGRGRSGRLPARGHKKCGSGRRPCLLSCVACARNKPCRPPSRAASLGFCELCSLRTASRTLAKRRSRRKIAARGATPRSRTLDEKPVFCSRRPGA